MDGETATQEYLSGEIVRKLRLATEADKDEDREIICQEVFCDVTGLLDEQAKEQLGVGSQEVCFYEVLAPYYLKISSAEALFFLCRRLWGQPYVAPIFTLLLHRWLLLRKDAGGADQRQKHVNVLALGARQLFRGDVHSNLLRFRPLFKFLAYDVVLSDDQTASDHLPLLARATLLSLVASYFPYYCDPVEMVGVIARFPGPGHLSVEGSGPAAVTVAEGADFFIAEVTDELQRIGSEDGLLRYLHAITALRDCEHIRALRTITRLRLQSELYSLTSSGGPRYAPLAVQRAAMAALDALFPLGRLSRRAVRLLFTWLHPIDWLELLWLRPLRSAAMLYAALLSAVLRLFARLVMRTRAAFTRSGWRGRR